MSGAAAYLLAVAVIGSAVGLVVFGVWGGMAARYAPVQAVVTPEPIPDRVPSLATITLRRANIVAWTAVMIDYFGWVFLKHLMPQPLLRPLARFWGFEGLSFVQLTLASVTLGAIVAAWAAARRFDPPMIRREWRATAGTWACLAVFAVLDAVHWVD